MVFSYYQEILFHIAFKSFLPQLYCSLRFTMWK